MDIENEWMKLSEWPTMQAFYVRRSDLKWVQPIVMDGSVWYNIQVGARLVTVAEHPLPELEDL